MIKFITHTTPGFRSTNGSPTQLFSTLMILKAACMHNQCYIDRLITTFMKVLHKMAREHLQPTSTETSPSKCKQVPVICKYSPGKCEIVLSSLRFYGPWVWWTITSKDQGPVYLLPEKMTSAHIYQ